MSPSFFYNSEGTLERSENGSTISVSVLLSWAEAVRGRQGFLLSACEQVV